MLPTRLLIEVAMNNTIQTGLVDRLIDRLADPDSAEFRAGVRAVAHQVVERRIDVIRVLRGRLAEFRDVDVPDFRRGYHECLLDVLMAAEAALESDSSNGLDEGAPK